VMPAGGIWFAWAQHSGSIPPARPGQHRARVWAGAEPGGAHTGSGPTPASSRTPASPPIQQEADGRLAGRISLLEATPVRSDAYLLRPSSRPHPLSRCGFGTRTARRRWRRRAGFAIRSIGSGSRTARRRGRSGGPNAPSRHDPPSPSRHHSFVRAGDSCLRARLVGPARLLEHG
jgi:hypothetical protein